MKIIEVPLLNDDGSVQAVVSLGPKEVQFLLEFALKFLTGVGVHAITAPLETNEDTKLSVVIGESSKNIQ